MLWIRVRESDMMKRLKILNPIITLDEIFMRRLLESIALLCQPSGGSILLKLNPAQSATVTDMPYTAYTARRSFVSPPGQRRTHEGPSAPIIYSSDPWGTKNPRICLCTPEYTPFPPDICSPAYSDLTATLDSNSLPLNKNMSWSDG
jgi:hypothetical protein